MTILRGTAIAFLAVTAAAAADKPNLENDIKEMFREVAQLEERMNALQKSLDDRLSAVTTQVRALGTSVDRVGASVAIMQRGVEQVGPAVTAQGGRIEHTSEALNTLQQAVADLTAAVNKLQTELGDVNNAVKAMAAPPVAPPGTEQKPAAADLINNAQGDESGGKSQLALQEYADYMKWYGETPMASVAQFRIGHLHYELKNYPAAIEAFEALAQKYPGSTMLVDALLLKRKSLQAMGKTAEAAAACQELRKRFAGSEQAKQCVVARR